MAAVDPFSTCMVSEGCLQATLVGDVLGIALHRKRLALTKSYLVLMVPPGCATVTPNALY